MVDKMTEIRCPGKKRHNKRRGNLLVSEEHCNTLIYFVDTSGANTTVARKCSDCKNIIVTTIIDNIAYVKVLDPKTKIELDTGKVVIE